MQKKKLKMYAIINGYNQINNDIIYDLNISLYIFDT